jgi:hypothetical protein
MMNQEIKARWVAALRDPSKKQGKNYLRNGWGNQCCLDVLCELAVADGILPEPVLHGGEDGYYEYTWTSVNGYQKYQSEVLPDPVVEWSGLLGENPVVSYKNPRLYE